MRFIFSLLFMVAVADFALARAFVDPQLEEVIARTCGDEKVEILVVLNEQADEDYLRSLATRLPRREQRYPVVAYLKEISANSQTPLLNYLSLQTTSNRAADIRSFWIVNAIACKITPDLFNEIVNLPEVAMVMYPCVASENILLTYGESVAVDKLYTRGIEWNIRKIAADSCWAAGYKGQGVIVGVIDTGVNYNHLDLATHMWTDPNYPHHGFNFEYGSDDPIDENGHGTHVAGIIASDGSAGDSCGMAPQCSIMALRVRVQVNYPMPDILSETNVFDAIQFAISPPLSPEHGVDVISMSLGWMPSWTPRRSLWRRVVTNVALAGIPFFIAAGNEGAGGIGAMGVPYNIRCPGDVPPPWHHPAEVQGRLGGAITIGATTEADTLASFSSRGPSTWEAVPLYWDYPYKPEPGILKPDLVAPGSYITSCAHDNNSGYVVKSGTSMATPHCAGLAALMLSKNPELTIAQIDSIMQFTALDLGTAGKDSMYGAGRIRAKLALDNMPSTGSLPDLRLVESGTVVLDPTPTGNNNAFFDPSETVMFVDTIVNAGSAVAESVVGILRTSNSSIKILDSIANFGTINPETRGDNGLDPFVVQADTLIKLGTLVPFELELVAQDYVRKLNFQLRMGSVCGPDSYGYFVLDNTDTLYTEAPVYNWFEINPNNGGPGFSIGPGGDNVVACLHSPFLIRHYRRRITDWPTDSITVSSNGWIAFSNRYGIYAYAYNSALPRLFDFGQQGSYSNMVAGFWDDLVVDNGGTWWYYHDTTNRRFIIQFDSVYSVELGFDVRQTFQFVIWDSIASGGSRNTIDIQYKKVMEPISCTIGQQDSLKKLGLCYLFNEVYDKGAAPVENGRVIRFTRNQPRMRNWLVNLEEYAKQSELEVKLMHVAPNPFRTKTEIRCQKSALRSKTQDISLKMYNAIGRLVKSFSVSTHYSILAAHIQWDGTDDLGHKLPAGVYFVQLDTGEFKETEKVVLLR